MVDTAPEALIPNHSMQPTGVAALTRNGVREQFSWDSEPCDAISIPTQGDRPQEAAVFGVLDSSV